MWVVVGVCFGEERGGRGGCGLKAGSWGKTEDFGRWVVVAAHWPHRPRHCPGEPRCDWSAPLLAIAPLTHPLCPVCLALLPRPAAGQILGPTPGQSRHRHSLSPVRADYLQPHPPNTCYTYYRFSSHQPITIHAHPPLTKPSLPSLLPLSRLVSSDTACAVAWHS